MADEADSQVSDETTVEDTAADSATENQTEEQTSQTDASTSVEDTGNQSDQDSKDDKSDDKPDAKPVSRRSAAYRIQQLTNENRVLKKQLAPEGQGEEDGTQKDEPDLQKLIDDAVEKRLNPVINESSKAADDGEINELFAGKPDLKAKYEPQIRNMWNLPQYKDLSAADLFKILDHNSVTGNIEQIKQQAVEDFKKADKEAKDSSASGTSNSNRSGKTGTNVAEMTPEELATHNEKVIAGRA